MLTMVVLKFDFAFYRVANSGPRPLWRIHIGSVGNRLEQRFSTATKRKHELVS